MTKKAVNRVVGQPPRRLSEKEILVPTTRGMEKHFKAFIDEYRTRSGSGELRRDDDDPRVSSHRYFSSKRPSGSGT
jgi:hypothetical protein